MGWLRSLIERLLRPYRRTPRPDRATRRAEADAPAVPEPERWNQFVHDGWVARWLPTTYSRRRDCMWVRRQGGELLVFPGSQDRPRTDTGPRFRLNDDIVYRASGHPEGPSSVPWMVIRNARAIRARVTPEDQAAARATAWMSP